jgi:hypothetical protein
MMSFILLFLFLFLHHTQEEEEEEQPNITACHLPLSLCQISSPSTTIH